MLIINEQNPKLIILPFINIFFAIVFPYLTNIDI
jgi:hypothetical protein